MKRLHNRRVVSTTKKPYMALEDVNQMEFQTLSKITTEPPKLVSLLFDSSHLS